MPGSLDYRTRIVTDLSQVGRDAWDALVRSSTGGTLPAFLRFDFLDSLARTGCVGPGTGWQTAFLTLWSQDALKGAVPMYLKDHSYGEYVFDWAWAEAYQQHGLAYYPKLLCAIPFTPVAGPRLIAADDAGRTALARALVAQARKAGVSSLHVLFPPEAQAQALADAGMMIRRGVQFHWQNNGYRSFDEFLASLAQPKRKKIRAERRKVQEAGVTLRRLTGAQITQRDWHFFARCYEATYAAHQSTPYLSEEFFQHIGQTMPEHLVLVLAQRGSQPIAASLLVRDHDRLYGRYWGALEHVPCLHFEAAYYQAIEAAIEGGIALVEGGAQGEHKMARGFLPVPTCSAHWLAHPAFADAVDRFLRNEDRMIGAYMDELDERTPFVRERDDAGDH